MFFKKLNIYKILFSACMEPFDIDRTLEIAGTLIPSSTLREINRIVMGTVRNELLNQLEICQNIADSLTYLADSPEKSQAVKLFDKLASDLDSALVKFSPPSNTD